MKSNLIKVVTGIRRCGKSTLTVMGKNLEQISYINFDDERLFTLTTKDLNSVYQVLLELNSNPDVFIFDEIQNIAGWELFLNRLQRKKINIIITGSNGKLLSKDLATHLTGRHLSMELFPLSCKEYFHLNKLSDKTLNTPSTEERALIYKLTTEYIKSGGFPEVALGEPAGFYLRELFNKIIGRDILQRYSVKSTKSLHELAIYLVQNSGSIVSFQLLARAFDFKSVHTLKTYFSYLVDCYLIFEVLHFSNKTKERFTLPRKIYAVDTGLQRALSLTPDSEIGLSLETAVFLELYRKNKEVYYMRSTQHEVDFVVCQNGKAKKLIQSCWSLVDVKTRSREIKALFHFAELMKVDELKIITWSEESNIENQNGKKIQIIPFWKFCAVDL